jgi:hypothetical protein
VVRASTTRATFPRPNATIATDHAVCGVCGFNEVGTAGCAPKLDGVIDPGDDGVFPSVQRGDHGFDVVSVKR